MKKHLLSFCLMIFVMYSKAAIIYVNQNALGLNNGSSWLNAYTSLQSGIASTTPGDQIWVAAGTYKPSTTNNRNTSFFLPSGVGIYGGFNGSETLLSERDWSINETILSGDIGNPGSIWDNSYNVVWASGVTSNTRLDGFKIMSGYATTSSNGDLWGGGIRVINSSLTVANCHFTANRSDECASALAMTNSGGPTTGILNLINCDFTFNSGDISSTVFLRGTQANVINCNFSNNEGSEVVFVDDGIANFDRCIFSGNTTIYSVAWVEDFNTVGGTLNIYNSLFVGNFSEDVSCIWIRPTNVNTHNIWNCTFSGNKSISTDSYDVLFLSENARVRNCIVWGNHNNQSIGLDGLTDVRNSIVQGGFSGIAISTANPLFINPGNAVLAPFDASAFDYRLSPSSSGINGGNNNFVSSIYNLDLSDSSRISAGTVDLGCYEKQYCSANITITPSGPTTFCSGGFVTLSASAGNSFNWSNGANSQNTAVSTQGNYTVTVIDNNGCYGTASQQINVFPASVQINGNTTICNNTNTTLTATSPNGNIFVWSNGQNGSQINVTQPNTYSVTVTTLNSCTASATVTVNSSTVSTPIITQNGNTLSSNVSNGNQWYLNGNIINGANSQNYLPTQNGTYTVIVTNSDGCISDESVGINFLATNINEISLSDIIVYPNPTNGQVSIKCNFNVDKLRIRITDLAGKQVFTLQNAEKSTTLNLSTLDKGVYFLNISNESSRQTVKLLLQ